MVALVCGQVAWAAWTAQRIIAWLDGAQAAQMAEVLEVREHLEPLLQFLARWHPLPGKINELVQVSGRRPPPLHSVRAPASQFTDNLRSKPHLS